MDYYNPWHLNLALKLREKVRRFSQNPKNYKHFLKLTMFLEVLFDIKHQETFSQTIPNKYANRDFELLKGYKVPKYKE